MPLQPWNPWDELQRLKSRTDRLWDEFLEKLTQSESRQTAIAFLPDVDLVETADEFRVYLSVPGLIEEDIDIDIDQRWLTVRGERQPPYDLQRPGRRLREWRYGYFQRRVQLPVEFRAEQIRATYEAGVLTIVLTKSSG